MQANSDTCTVCKNWIHKRSSGVLDDLSLVVDGFRCKRCDGTLQESGSKRRSLQAVELSRRLQTAEQIVSKPANPSNRCPIYRFWAIRPCGPAEWLALLLIKAGDIETNPGPTTTHKSGFSISAINKYMPVGSIYR